MKMTEKKQTVIDALRAQYGNIVTRNQILEWVKTNVQSFEGSVPPKGVDFPYWITNNKDIRVGRAAYNLDTLVSTATVKTATVEETNLSA